MIRLLSLDLSFLYASFFGKIANRSPWSVCTFRFENIVCILVDRTIYSQVGKREVCVVMVMKLSFGRELVNRLWGGDQCEVLPVGCIGVRRVDKHGSGIASVESMVWSIPGEGVVVCDSPLDGSDQHHARRVVIRHVWLLCAVSLAGGFPVKPEPSDKVVLSSTVGQFGVAVFVRMGNARPGILVERGEVGKLDSRLVGLASHPERQTICPRPHVVQVRSPCFVNRILGGVLRSHRSHGGLFGVPQSCFGKGFHVVVLFIAAVRVNPVPVDINNLG